MNRAICHLFFFYCIILCMLCPIESMDVFGHFGYNMKYIREKGVQRA